MGLEARPALGQAEAGKDRVDRAKLARLHEVADKLPYFLGVGQDLAHIVPDVQLGCGSGLWTEPGHD